MALTTTERQRLEDLEEDVRRIAQLVKGGGSKNQLNRLLILAQEQSRRLTIQLEQLETKVEDDLLPLVRRLQ